VEGFGKPLPDADIDVFARKLGIDGEVIYNGGPIRHGAGFVFVNCIFDMQTTDIPDQQGKAILVAALENETFIDTSSKSSATHS
jgi:hypothetical protein